MQFSSSFFFVFDYVQGCYLSAMPFFKKCARVMCSKVTAPYMHVCAYLSCLKVSCFKTKFYSFKK